MHKLDKYAVTRGEWYQYCLDSGYPLPAAWDGKPPIRPHETVTYVTWREVVAYCAYYGCRLPTEGEWMQAFNSGELADCTLYNWLLDVDGEQAALRGCTWYNFYLAASRSCRNDHHIDVCDGYIGFRCLREVKC